MAHAIRIPACQARETKTSNQQGLPFHGGISRIRFHKSAVVSLSKLCATH
jgi:hypothetical protein